MTKTMRRREMDAIGRGLPLTFPFTPGSDLAGTVMALGEEAARLAVGSV